MEPSDTHVQLLRELEPVVETAEENRHGIAPRDYLPVTRAIDPLELAGTVRRLLR